MKTKNNVQKTFLRTVAVIISFVLLSITVTAQGYWKQLLTNNSFNHIASALVDHSEAEAAIADNTTLFDAEAFYTEESEAGLEIEPWMIAEPVAVISWSMNTEVEPGLEIEEWMFNDLASQAGLDQEKSLQLEDWMMSSSI